MQARFRGGPLDWERREVPTPVLHVYEHRYIYDPLTHMPLTGERRPPGEIRTAVYRLAPSGEVAGAAVEEVVYEYQGDR